MAKLRFQAVILTVLFFKEGNKFIAYNPALDISTCGDSMEQAKKRFKELEEIFFEELERMGTLEDVLLECGWGKVGHPKKYWQPPMVIGQTEEKVKIPCPV